MNPITIIGSGLAGYTLVREFRKLDPETPVRMITRDDGCYYSKPQLSSAFTHKKLAENLALSSAAKMAEQLNIDIITKSVVSKIDADNHLIFIDQHAFPYSSLILAQGAQIIKPPLTGTAIEKVVSVNDLEDYDNFRNIIAPKKNITLLGAGLVGCEFANDLLNGGFQINIIALASTPLDILLPAELGLVLKEAFASKGINWHLNCSIQSVDYDQADDLRLTLSNGTTVKTDVLLSAIGLKPTLELATQAGINTNRGILVDRLLKTNKKDIYALGDCAEVEGHVLFYVAPLVACARALAQTLVNQPTSVSYPPMPAILKTPACPIVANPPPIGLPGDWTITGENPDKIALFHDKEKKLQGFALMGKCVTEKMALIKELSPFF